MLDNPRRSAVVSLGALLACLVFVSSAGAADKYRYTMTIQPAAYSGTAAGGVNVQGLDASKSTTVRVLRLGVQQYASAYAMGSTGAGLPAASLSAGDQIEVQQPTGSVQETVTVPAVSLAGSAGSATVSGQAPDGSIAIASFQPECFGFDDDDFASAPHGGVFSAVYPRPLVAGSVLRATVYPGKGDVVRFNSRVPGETPCITATSFVFPTSIAGTPDPKPYSIRANQFRPAAGTGARIVLRRGGAILIDKTDVATTSSINADTAVQPQGGDVIEVYRPHTAPTPSANFTIPSVNAVYDPSNGLVDVDAPPASVLQVFAGSIFTKGSNLRGAVDTGAGITRLNFSLAQGTELPVDLAGVDFVDTDWYSPNRLNLFETGVRPGDLRPPTLKLKLAKRLKITSIGSTISASVTSSEVANAKLSLTLPSKLKAAKAKKPTVVATTKGTLKAGTKRFKLKLTKSGKKLLKRIRARGLPTQTATLTVTATDAAGNKATKTKTMKLVP